MTRPTTSIVVLRALIAALAGAIGGIHLDLWYARGYRHIPTIGALFLLNAVAGFLLAIGSLTLPSRVLPLAWLATAGYSAATLVALLISLNVTLFGFTETASAALLVPSVGIEATALVVCTTGAVLKLLSRGRR